MQSTRYFTPQLSFGFWALLHRNAQKCVFTNKNYVLRSLHMPRAFMQVIWFEELGLQLSRPTHPHALSCDVARQSPREIKKRKNTWEWSKTNPSLYKLCAKMLRIEVKHLKPVLLKLVCHNPPAREALAQAPLRCKKGEKAVMRFPGLCCCRGWKALF